MSDTDINREGLDDALEAVSEQPAPRYLAYHCRYCKDTGTDDGSHDPTMRDNVNRCARSCFACDGFGAILILARLRQDRRKPYQGARWPERDI